MIDTSEIKGWILTVVMILFIVLYKLNEIGLLNITGGFLK